MAIIIDGKVFQGNNITIRNGRVTIDGRPQDGELHGVIEVKITEGTLHNLDTDSSVTCGSVSGYVSAGGSVTCGDVGGTAQAGGSITAKGRLGGTIQAGGSVRIG